jgi:hypothetical protein
MKGRLVVKPEFISIVGVSRSGTTLMLKILNESDQIAICRENHFLGHLISSEGARYKFRKFGDLEDDENVYKLVDYIYCGEFDKDSKFKGMSPHWEWLVKRVDREEFLQRILDSDRSERALFSVALRVFADRQGKPIAGEKTPAHIRYVPTLLEWFPDGKILHMLRDPRAVFVSELRRRKGLAITTPYKQLKRSNFLFTLFVMLQTTLVWFESVYRYYKYRKLYPENYYLLRFEDLVTDPEKYVRQVCNFLGVDFQQKMLDQVVTSRGFRTGQTGFDAQAATRWKRYISPWIKAWFSFWFRRYLKEFGYID